MCFYKPPSPKGVFKNTHLNKLTKIYTIVGKQGLSSDGFPMGVSGQSEGKERSSGRGLAI